MRSRRGNSFETNLHRVREKDLESGSKCDKRKNWKFCKKIDAKSIKRNYEKCWGFRVQFRECFIYECSFIHQAKDKTLDDKFLRIESYFSSVEITYLKVTLTINYQKITFEINSREFYSQGNALFTFNTWKIF